MYIRLALLLRFEIVIIVASVTDGWHGEESKRGKQSQKRVGALGKRTEMGDDMHVD